jgi:hypothetical protein
MGFQSTDSADPAMAVPGSSSAPGSPELVHSQGFPDRTKSQGLLTEQALFYLVETRRIELLTFALRTRRSPS